MYKAFWRAVYAITYWRVFLPGKASTSKKTAPKADGDSIGARIVSALMFLVLVMPGIAFGYLTWTHGERLEAQRAVDRAGVAVMTKVAGTQIDVVRHQSTTAAGERTTPQPSLFCNIAVTYQMPGSSEELRKQFRLEDEKICQRYKPGDAIAARALPEIPAVMVLDEGRLDTFWYWICLALFIVLAVLPALLLVRGMLRRDA